MRTVGTVVGLWRYPVKSMAGQELAGTDVSWHGLAGDRRWAFLRDGVPRNGFPWFTIRQRAELCRYRPWFADPAEPDSSKTFVTTPDGGTYEVIDPALAALLGGGVRAVKLDRGTFDALPLSLITTGSAGALDVRRFRPNLVIDAPAGAEDDWVGSVLRVGGLRLRVDRRDRRCMIVNVDPVTTQRDPEVLRTIARERDLCLGVYGSTVEPGPVAVGDAVLVDRTQYSAA
ncbi:MOSC domain-containing protein [Amycolatopsis sp. GM8]|uniref:MOSC domain-containing protein n=1 Tax=Amycolatopsis sp. GM8 TaxID=2896530 RepID=UPI001F02F079|nr:MOSC N-terminal beta barrel domain-containing protein [Amycolatopsis sp. GM8]